MTKHYLQLSSQADCCFLFYRLTSDNEVSNPSVCQHISIFFFFLQFINSVKWLKFTQKLFQEVDSRHHSYRFYKPQNDKIHVRDIWKHRWVREVISNNYNHKIIYKYCMRLKISYSLENDFIIIISFNLNNFDIFFSFCVFS